MLIEKKFTGVRKGREPRYNFQLLRPDTMLIIEPTVEDLKDIHRFRTRVRAALYQFKKNNDNDWETATRIDGDNMNVYRIK